MKKIWPFLFLLFISFAGCKSTEITSEFKPKNTAKGGFYKILVLGMTGDGDLELQQKMEQHLAEDLVRQGYQVITSLAAYGPKAFSGLSEEQALEKFKNSGVEAVMTIVLLNKKMEKQFVAAGKHQRPVQNYQNMFLDYYGTVSSRVWEPGYYFENTEYYWESNLYTLQHNTLLYSVQTTSFNPASTNTLAHQYGKTIVQQLRKKGITEKNPEPVKKGF